jgi:two-component system alkaline phosphatase synthesis response regulator PhoP
VIFDISGRRVSLSVEEGAGWILVAEDDQDIAELIAHHLGKAGYFSQVVYSGDKVLSLVKDEPPRLIILDLMLPGQNGLDICRAIRSDSRSSNIPIIMVTAKTEETDRIVGLELGADDYVTKPFSPKELISRVGAVLRRSNRTNTVPSLLEIGPITVDVESYRVTLDGREVRLTAKEFLLLKYFAEHQGRVLSRDVLLSDVWGYKYTGGTRTVDVHVRHLREKLPVLSHALVTVKQFGYKLVIQENKSQ